MKKLMIFILPVLLIFSACLDQPVIVSVKDKNIIEDEGSLVQENEEENEIISDIDDENENQNESELEVEQDTESDLEGNETQENENETPENNTGEGIIENDGEENSENETEENEENEGEENAANEGEENAANEGEETNENQENETGTEQEIEQNPEQDLELELSHEESLNQEEGNEEDSENETEIIVEEIKKSLTLMVYMAADNDLESYALQNLKMMEYAKPEDINILVLLDRAEGYDETDGNWTDTRLFEVCKDSTKGRYVVSKRLDSPMLGLSSEENTELDMANPYVLKSFVEFCKDNYETDMYALIIWGHGTGWRYAAEKYKGESGSRAVAIDDKTGSYMRVSELGQAVRGQGLHVIGFDACFGGAFENVYELKDCAEYTVACPGVTPSGGWNYTGLLEKLTGRELTSIEIAQEMAASSSVKTTIFINEKLDGLMNSFENYSRLLAATIRTSEDRNSVFNNLLNAKSYSYTQYPCDLYLDIYSIADLYTNSFFRELAQASYNLKNKVLEAAFSLKDEVPGIGIHFIPMIATHVAATVHSSDYIKNQNAIWQSSFVKESLWWVPTIRGNSGSLLDKLFYTIY